MPRSHCGGSAGPCPPLQPPAEGGTAIRAREYLRAGGAGWPAHSGHAGQHGAGTGQEHRGIARGREMRASYSLSCLFLLSLGACFPHREWQELAQPREGIPLKPSWQAVAWDRGGDWRAGAKRRRSEELGTLLGIARELRGYGKEGARARLGRQGGSELLPSGGEKRSGALGNLAEELNGYNRRKGGFTFRFGR